MRRTPPLLVALLVSSTALLHAADEKVDCRGAAEKGQALRDDKKLRAARAMFLKCATTKCPKVIRDDCANLFLPQVESALPTVVLRARDERGNDLVQVRVSVDGELLTERLEGAAVPMDPGPRVFRFEAGGQAVEQRLVIAEGEKNRSITVDFRPTEPAPGPTAQASARAPAPTPTPAPTAPPTAKPGALPWVLIGVGAVSLASFGGLQIWARSQKSDLEGGCGKARTCPDDEVSAVRTKFVASGVALALGVVGLGVGGGLLLLGGKGEQAALRVGPAVGGASLSLDGSF